MSKEKVKKKGISGEVYDINKPKSKIISRVHYAQEPTRGPTTRI